MPMIEGFLPYPSFVQLRFGKWQEALDRPEPPKTQRVAHVFWQYARGVALAQVGRIGDAQDAQAAMMAEAKELPGETPFGLNSASSVIEVARHVLAAKIATRQGRPDAALESWRQAVAAEDALNYDEPPGWYYPVRESLGAALFESGRPAEAEKVFREDLVTNPGNGRSLFGLYSSLEAQGKTDEAKQVQRQFKKAWRKADSKLQIASLR
jgi:tetratricopeptide (TPR) repeat protein